MCKASWFDCVPFFNRTWFQTSKQEKKWVFIIPWFFRRFLELSRSLLPSILMTQNWNLRYLLGRDLTNFNILISSRIFDNVIAKWTFCVQQFFCSVLLQKLRVQPLLFFLLLISFSSIFLFLLSFSFGLKKPVFWRLFPQMTANVVRLVLKKIG